MAPGFNFQDFMVLRCLRLEGASSKDHRLGAMFSRLGVTRRQVGKPPQHSSLSKVLQTNPINPT